MPGRACIVKAVLGRGRFRPDPAFEAGMARFLAAEHGRDYLLELYQRNLLGEDKFGQMMRRVIIKAVARRCGDGLIVGSQVGFKHLETLQIGNTCFIGCAGHGVVPAQAGAGHHPPLRSRVPICVAQVRQPGDASRFENELTEKHHSAENAVAERVNGILKQEYYLDANFETKPEAGRAVVQGVDLYNYRRPHTALGLRTPGMVHGAGQKN